MSTLKTNMFENVNAKFALSMHDKWITRTLQWYHNSMQDRVKVPLQDTNTTTTYKVQSFIILVDCY